MDLDLRKVRYFTAVAEHEHIGRAAEALCIAQPALSRQIRALDAETMITTPGDPPGWHDAAAEPRVVTVTARSIEEILEHVAAGRGLVILPLSAAAYFSRSDLTYIPLADVAPSPVYLAWERSRRSPLVREYTQIAGETLRLPPIAATG